MPYSELVHATFCSTRAVALVDGLELVLLKYGEK